MVDFLIKAVRSTLNEINIHKSRLLDLNNQIKIEQDNLVRLKKDIAEWEHKHEIKEAKYWSENSRLGCDNIDDESDTPQELKDLNDDLIIFHRKVSDEIEELCDGIEISEKVCDENLKESATVGEKIATGNLCLESEVSQLTQNLNAANADLIWISDSQLLEISNLLKDCFV